MREPDTEPAFDYDNLTGRPTGPVTRALGLVLPGVALVQRQVRPYAAAWQTANAAARDGGRVRWVALGDSMTQGIGASAPQNGWIGQLSRRLGEPADVLNLSQSGARVADVIDSQLPAWRALGAPPAGEFVTVLIGSNDVISPRHRAGLPEAVATLLDQLPSGAIVSAVPSPARPAQLANEHIRAAGASGAIRAVRADRIGPGAWRGKLAADRFHPNDAGYSLIADVFAADVRSALLALTGPAGG